LLDEYLLIIRCVFNIGLHNLVMFDIIIC